MNIQTDYMLHAVFQYFDTHLCVIHNTQTNAWYIMQSELSTLELLLFIKSLNNLKQFSYKAIRENFNYLFSKASLNQIIFELSQMNTITIFSTEFYEQAKNNQ